MILSLLDQIKQDSTLPMVLKQVHELQADILNPHTSVKMKRIHNVLKLFIKSPEYNFQNPKHAQIQLYIHKQLQEVAELLTKPTNQLEKQFSLTMSSLIELKRLLNTSDFDPKNKHHVGICNFVRSILP